MTQRRAVIVLAIVLMTVTPAWAGTDYSTMSNEELSQVRGTMREASDAEKDSFRSEWQQRAQNMTTEERQQYTGRPASAQADGSYTQQGTGQGRGSGGGGGRRMGH